MNREEADVENQEAFILLVLAKNSASRVAGGFDTLFPPSILGDKNIKAGFDCAGLKASRDIEGKTLGNSPSHNCLLLVLLPYSSTCWNSKVRVWIVTGDISAVGAMAGRRENGEVGSSFGVLEEREEQQEDRERKWRLRRRVLWTLVGGGNECGVWGAVVEA